jgi:hypothetical protein
VSIHRSEPNVSSDILDPHYYTTDLWEAATLFALGFEPSHVSAYEGFFHLALPFTDDRLHEARASYQDGSAVVLARRIKAGYYHAGRLMTPIREGGEVPWLPS